MSHDFHALAVMLVQAGHEYIVEQAAGKTGGVSQFFLEAALTAQRNLVVDPKMALTSQDFDRLTAELERLTHQFESSCTDVNVSNPPETRDDSEDRVSQVRASIQEILENAADVCAQPTFEEFAQLVLKAWSLIVHNTAQATLLSRFRTALVKAYVAEFKLAHTKLRSNLN